ETHAGIAGTISLRTSAGDLPGSPSIVAEHDRIERSPTNGATVFRTAWGADPGMLHVADGRGLDPQALQLQPASDGCRRACPVGRPWWCPRRESNPHAHGTALSRRRVYRFATRTLLVATGRLALPKAPLLRR